MTDTDADDFLSPPPPPPEPGPPSREEARAQIQRLRELAGEARTDDEMRRVTAQIASLTRQYRIQHGIGLPADPAAQAQEIDDQYQIRPHLKLLSNRLADAVRKVERGQNQHLTVSMPPRSGKSTLTSFYFVLWLLRRHPEWKTMLISYDGGLTAGWARQIRYLIEGRPDLGVALKRDTGAGSKWETAEGGGVFATGIGGPLVGRGAKVMLIDDPVSDFVSAHNPKHREALWNWWLAVAQTRLEPPYLVLSIATRWHEDDFIGRLLSDEHEGSPTDWEKIVLAALADRPDDPLGREEGAPLYSPLLEETELEAIARWNSVKETVGTYTFAAQYQQRPAPAKGAIFDAGWWRYWTNDPAKATDDGRIRYLDPSTLTSATWLDSWDMAFKEGGDWVVGQRWVRSQANRFLIMQTRGRWSFTQTLAQMEKWASNESWCGHLVHKRLVEEKANGAAIIDTLRDKVSGLKPINPKTSKEARARAITPEVESGNVYLPHPTDPGNEWVSDLLSELRNFPHDAHDDQTDTLTQALAELRDEPFGHVTVPGRSNGAPARRITGSRAAAARSDLARHRR